MERNPDQNFRGWLVGGLIAVLAILWIAWWQWDRISGAGRNAATPQAAPVAQLPDDLPTAAAPGLAESTERDRLERLWSDATGSPPVWPENLGSPPDCRTADSDLLAICRTLDSREYVKSRLQGGGSCAMFRQVAEELAVRPPKVSGELKSYPAMLANVFHLFRVVGRERLALPREILARDPELLEPLSMALYRWLISREQCSAGRETAVDMTALYEYSSFLIQTMGGQAYLRRRAPRVEGLAGFYSLLIVDRAIGRKFNPHGIDPRAEIARNQELLAGQPLVFGEEYQAMLDAMVDRWERLDPQ